MTDKLYVATQVFVEQDIVIETNVLGIWSEWDEALRYVSNRHDFERAVVTSQAHPELDRGSLPVWSWRARNGIWETVTICPLHVQFVDPRSLAALGR